MRSLGLAREVSASHEESPPHTRSPAPTSAWAQTHSASIATDACGGTNLHVTQEQQLAAMQAAYPGKSLNVGLTGCAAITSPSSPTLPHTRLSLRHSSTLYDAHKPRLKLGRGKLGKYSGRLRQAQTTRGEGQASRSKQSNPAMRRPPYKASRVGFNAPRRTATYDGTCQLPSTVTLFYFPLCPSPCDYKRERRATVTRVRPP
jgi:hypothetical protein